MSGQLPDWLTVGVGQKEEASPLVWSAGFRRAEEARFHVVTQVLKVGAHDVEAEGDVTGHVFGKEQGRPGFDEHAPHVGPQVAFVGASPALAGHAEGLTGPSGSDDIHRATPRATVEGGKVGPHRRVIQGRFFHPGHERGRGVGVSLDPTNSAISR